MTSDNLFSLHQEKGETLCDNVAHFNTATLEVHSLDEAVAMSALKRGLRNEHLIISLNKKYSRTMLTS